MLSPAVEALVALALEEDLGRGDVTSEAIFAAGDTSSGQIVAKEPLVVAGVAVVAAVFARVDRETRFVPRLEDGAHADKGAIVAVVEGRTRGLLSAERTALNFLQRLSGVATLTRRFVDAVAGTRAKIVDTRKTTPGWRLLEKEAVRAGGGANHRVDLAAGVLIKDNHVAACGGVKQAVERARARAPHSLRIEVEVTALAQIEEALAAGADIVLVDNFVPADVARAVKQIAGRALVEVSGGVNLETVRAYAEAGPDLISIGALTHSARAVDLSLEL
ncbi:MAG TPA: carboxylating nicotinate-nucleotide diphosphorylase [Polyangia bacterium]|nr:carboxylating nicotinate-nucleotide diphosphorylase [Polyangia bacterium]